MCLSSFLCTALKYPALEGIGSLWHVLSQDLSCLNDLERWVDTVHTCFANSSSGRGHVQIRHLPTFFPGTDAFDRCTLVSEVCSSERLSFLLYNIC